MTLDQMQKLTAGLQSPQFAGGGYLFDCPLCNRAQGLTARVLVGTDQEYELSLACFCGCDPHKIGEKLAQLSGLVERVGPPSKRRKKAAPTQHPS